MKLKTNTRSIARRNAREYALQALYQWQLADTEPTELITDFLIHQIKEQTDIEYFKELIKQIPDSVDELNVQLTPYLDRSIKELDPIELSALRIGIYELLKRPDIPYRVAINEALELTKKYGSVEGFKFVNGILDKVAKKLRPVETSKKNK